MKYLKYLLVGVFFGILMSKSEVVSWYRIYEMFRFDSFHMYGVIGSAIVIGIILIQLIKRTHMKSLIGTEISITPKKKGITRYLIGGIIFGLGWALTGACPGPMFVLVGHGVGVVLVVIVSATVGTFTYGVLRDKLLH